MMRMRTKPAAEMKPPPATGDELEVRPCGMLVQKRSPQPESAPPSSPTIRVRVKHGSVSHEIYVNSQATFGELKKLLSGPTGLHPLDQKVLFKDKERESTAYLDTSGVKNGSKLVVTEDLKAQAKRCLEMRRAAIMDKASTSISKITHQVDKMASKVSKLESIASMGKKVADSDLLSLTELLMNELLKLDEIACDGEVKQHRRMQVTRVQKYIETLDMLRSKNSNGQLPANDDARRRRKRRNSHLCPHQRQWLQRNGRRLIYYHLHRCCRQPRWRLPAIQSQGLNGRCFECRTSKISYQFGMSWAGWLAGIRVG